MRKFAIVLSATAALLVAFAVSSFAGEVCITGEGTCAKCGLKQAEKCQNVIKAEKDGKEVTYWLVGNDVSKKFHSNICQGPAKVTATGTVEEAGGKMMLTVSKIELAK